MASSDAGTGCPEVPGPVPGGKLVRLPPKNFLPVLVVFVASTMALAEVPGSLVVSTAAVSFDENIDLRPKTMKVRQSLSFEKVALTHGGV